MSRIIGFLVLLALVTAGALPTAAASGAGSGETSVPCEGVELVCDLLGCDATNPNKLVSDPISTIVNCI